MKVHTYKKLSKQQGSEIRRVAKSLDLRIVDVAKHLNFADTRLHDILAGRSNIHPEHAIKLYNFLRKNKSIGFLLGYSKGEERKETKHKAEIYKIDSFDAVSKEIQEYWSKMFDYYVKYIKNACQTGGEYARYGVLGDLEKLAIKYKVQ